MDPRTPTLERLVRLPLFSNCTMRQLALVANRTNTIRARAGDVLMRQGTTGREVVILVEGFADVYTDGRHVAAVGPGDIVGEMALLDDEPRSATVVASTDLVAEVSTPAEFTELLEAVPSLGSHLLTQMAGRLRRELART